MRNVGCFCCLLILVTTDLVGCTAQPSSKDRPESHASQAGQPVDPLRTAAHLAAIDAGSLVGDRKAVQDNMRAMQNDLRTSIKLPDQSRPIDHEMARQAAKRVAGVRSVVWMDRENLFAIVERNEQRSYGTIDGICHELEPLGDTLGVVVNLQSGAARNGDELEILSRNCQLAPGDRALMQRNRQFDVLSPAIRREQKATNGR